MLQHPEHTKYDPDQPCICPKCGHTSGPHIEYHKTATSFCHRTIPNTAQHLCVSCSVCDFTRSYKTVDEK